MSFIYYIAIALFATWAVISRPDRWAGASEYPQAITGIVCAFVRNAPADNKDLARFRYLNLMCLATASFSMALLYGIDKIAPTMYTVFVFNLCKAWFVVTIISLIVGINIGPPLKK